MKNVFKKLFSLMLVAVMLVSVLPMTALADTDDGTANPFADFHIDIATVSKEESTQEGFAWIAGTNYNRVGVTAEGKPDTAKPDWAGNGNTNGWMMPDGSVKNWKDIVLTEGDFTDGVATIFPVFKNTTTPPTTEPTPPTTEPTPPTTEPTPPTTEPTPPTTEPTPPTTEPTPPTTEPASTDISVNFKDEKFNSGVVTNATVKEGETLKVPAVKDQTGWRFDGWFVNGEANKKVDNKTTYAQLAKWATNNVVECTAKYTDVRDRSTVRIYVERYVGKTLKETKELDSVVLDAGVNAFDWLYENKTNINNRIFTVFSADDYKWDNYLYDYTGKKELTQQNLEVNGAKKVVVKIFAKNNAMADVTVHVYKYVKDKAVDNTKLRDIDLDNYANGEVVTIEAVKAAVGKYYNGDMQGLYDSEAWTDLKNGQKPTAANGVTADGRTHIYVIMKNVTNAKPDSSNPKTGDSIFMTMTVMTLSVTALAVLVLTNKKRMVK